MVVCWYWLVMIFKLNIFLMHFFYCFVIFKWWQFLATINRTNGVWVVFQCLSAKMFDFPLNDLKKINKCTWEYRKQPIFSIMNIWIQMFHWKQHKFLICCLHLKHPMFKIPKICPKSKGFTLETCCFVGYCCVGYCSSWTVGFCAVVA